MKRGSDGPGSRRFRKQIHQVHLSPPLENDPSTFVRRRGGLEAYPSKPVCPPCFFDTLKSRGFVYAKCTFSPKVLVSLMRNAHFDPPVAKGPTIFTNSRSTAPAAVTCIYIYIYIYLYIYIYTSSTRAQAHTTMAGE